MRRGELARLLSYLDLPAPWWKLTAITQSCGVHMRPVGAGSRRQTTDSHNLGLQVRLQLLRCFRSLSCRADKAWTTGCPLVYHTGRTAISRAWESESERTDIVQVERLELRPEHATRSFAVEAARPMSGEGPVCTAVGQSGWPPSLTHAYTHIDPGGVRMPRAWTTGAAWSVTTLALTAP